jgi:colanic acid/amylovoran biosynthesis glycosyltransferase
MRVGYLATHYPAVSHTFVLREVLALRRLGVDVETFSIHRTPESELLADVDREEGARTQAVLPPHWARLAAAHLRAAIGYPGRYVDTLLFAVRRANPGVRGRLWGILHFASAIAVWDEARRHGVRHFHAIFADGASDVALLVTRFGARGWTWSLAIHGPVEFFDVYRNHLTEKVLGAQFTLAISDFGRSQLMALTDEERWKDIHVVRCGLGSDFLDSARSAPPQRTPGHILCVGRLAPVKGQAVLIEACASLISDGVPAHVTFVGAGPQRAQLEALALRHGIAEYVRFAGAVGQDRIREFFAAADVFCLPSFAEGLPVVLMEAMALGVPVVTTRIMGVPELVEDGETGLLVAPGHVGQLTAALAQLLNDQVLRERLAAQAYDKVRREFSVDHSARTLRGIFERALGETGRG